LLKSQAGDKQLSDLVYIVDDDSHFRAAVGRLLKLRGYEVAEYESADEFLERVSGAANPGCVLLDIRMPGLSGPELQRKLSEIGSSLPIIFLTGYADVPTTVSAIKRGAYDFLTKPVSEQALIESIKGAFARLEAERPKNEWMNSARLRLDTLTPREREVFDYVVRGVMNKETARKLGITERTIKAHRQRLFEKLGAKTVAELVSIAERLGLMS
jgi:FixJ family two-component response regulator